MLASIGVYFYRRRSRKFDSPADNASLSLIEALSIDPPPYASRSSSVSRRPPPPYVSPFAEPAQPWSDVGTSPPLSPYPLPQRPRPALNSTSSSNHSSTATLVAKSSRSTESLENWMSTQLSGPDGQVTLSQIDISDVHADHRRDNLSRTLTLVEGNGDNGGPRDDEYLVPVVERRTSDCFFVPQRWPSTAIDAAVPASPHPPENIHSPTTRRPLPPLPLPTNRLITHIRTHRRFSVMH